MADPKRYIVVAHLFAEFDVQRMRRLGAAIDWLAAACTSDLVSGGYKYKLRDDLRMGDYR